MKKPDVIPLVAWIIWEMFFEEPGPTDAQRPIDDSKGRIALHPYHPSARRAYQPAVLP